MHLKVSFAGFAMHLSPRRREVIFRQIDSLLDEDEWDSAARIPNQDAFRTALRLILLLASARYPSLAFDQDGHPVLSWVGDNCKLHLYALPRDMVRIVFERHRVDGVERGIVSLPLERVPDRLQGLDLAAATT